MTEPTSSARLRGLDVLRAAAILLVLMTHYPGFVSPSATFGVIGKVGWAGVDLFFVLACIHLDWPATLVTSTSGYSLLAIGFGLLPARPSRRTAY